VSEAARLARLAGELIDPLQRYIRRSVGDAATAEDLVQETLIRMARALRDFEGRSSARTWAFSIATHVIADHFRAPEERLRIVELDEGATATPAGEPAIDERMVIDEMNACVRRVIDGLPENYRAALVLHDLEGLTALQVAEVCGCSAATAKIRIHRARARLKLALSSGCDLYHDGDAVLRCDQKPYAAACSQDRRRSDAG